MPSPWDLVRAKAPRGGRVWVPPSRVPFHHQGATSSVCPSVSRGAVALEILQPHDQVLLVLQQELLAGFEGGAEVGGQSRHVGGDVVEVPRRSLVVVSHLRGTGDG